MEHAKSLLRDFEENKLDPSVTNEQLWRARRRAWPLPRALVSHPLTQAPHGSPSQGVLRPFRHRRDDNPVLPHGSLPPDEHPHRRGHGLVQAHGATLSVAASSHRVLVPSLRLGGGGGGLSRRGASLTRPCPPADVQHRVLAVVQPDLQRRVQLRQSVHQQGERARLGGRHWQCAPVPACPAAGGPTSRHASSPSLLQRPTCRPRSSPSPWPWA